MHLEGNITDFGDLLFQQRWIVKGRRLSFVWHIGPVLPSQPVDRFSHTSFATPSGKADIFMDLMADQKVALSAAFTDEVGNPTDTPTDATVTYTVDDTAVIALTDNGDGTAIATAVGPLGTATVHGVASFGGQTISGDLQIVVVAGLAERFTITPGTPEETTPDVTA
jgi:hypothetical protein